MTSSSPMPLFPQGTVVREGSFAATLSKSLRISGGHASMLSGDRFSSLSGDGFFFFPKSGMISMSRLLEIGEVFAATSRAEFMSHARAVLGVGVRDTHYNRSRKTAVALGVCLRATSSTLRVLLSLLPQPTTPSFPSGRWWVVLTQSEEGADVDVERNFLAAEGDGSTGLIPQQGAERLLQPLRRFYGVWMGRSRPRLLLAPPNRPEADKRVGIQPLSQPPPAPAAAAALATRVRFWGLRSGILRCPTVIREFLHDSYRPIEPRLSSTSFGDQRPGPVTNERIKGRVNQIPAVAEGRFSSTDDDCKSFCRALGRGSKTTADQTSSALR
mmetsp:Transcript_13339/g.24867  ORF Transcript_13339/g.24867 Transcript_13339/m.24867 type:complete len:328 (-) Transcript_13339:785-1768(-)